MTEQGHSSVQGLHQELDQASAPLPSHTQTLLAGEPVWLVAGKAMYWPQRRVLCVADVHLGKAASYRALGQPVPHGTTAANLQRLDALLAHYPSRQLVFLGDLLHAPAALNASLLASLMQWRQQHAALQCTLVRGNHDLRAGDPPPQLGIEIVDEPHMMGGFALCHMPVPRVGRYVVAGHQHPAYQLQGRGRQRLRLPCFHLTTDLAVLPAFGDFTGSFTVSAQADSQVYVTDGSAIWPVRTDNGRTNRA